MSENNALSPQELELIEILIDPVRFAKYRLTDSMVSEGDATV